MFTHGSHGGADAAEQVDYGAVRNVLGALGSREARIALMTAIGVTKHTSGHDWKRRGERLVRASGLPYTIVRPGWFDYNDPDQQQLVMLQGDRRWAGDPSDGVVSRAQIAQTLVASLTSAAAARKHSNSLPSAGPRSQTSTRCLPHWSLIRPTGSTVSWTATTCRWSRSRPTWSPNSVPTTTRTEPAPWNSAHSDAPVPTSPSSASAP